MAAMTKEQFDEFEHSMIEEFEFALFEFVKRAASEGATAEEVQALPAVAELFKKTLLGY